MASRTMASTFLLFTSYLLGLSWQGSPHRLQNSFKESGKQANGLEASEEMICVRDWRFLSLLKNQLVNGFDFLGHMVFVIAA